MASSATLTTLTDRVEMTLRDSGNVDWSADEIQEGIRTALHRYNDVAPRRAITTTALAAAGREIDISAIDYITIERVWWDYDSTDPQHPPRWRDFEVWPGDLLFIKDPDEPQSGDTVRIWYTCLHTLNLLDSATATTFTDEVDTLLVTGAAALAAHSRSLDAADDLNVDGWVHKRLRIWAEQKLAEFDTCLEAIKHQQAAQHSGVAPVDALDRWDEDGSGWW